VDIKSTNSGEFLLRTLIWGGFGAGSGGGIRTRDLRVMSSTNLN